MGKVVGKMHKHDSPEANECDLAAGTVWQCDCGQKAMLRGGRELGFAWDYNIPQNMRLDSLPTEC